MLRNQNPTHPPHPTLGGLHHISACFTTDQKYTYTRGSSNTWSCACASFTRETTYGRSVESCEIYLYFEMSRPDIGWPSVVNRELKRYTPTRL